jgi:hypothetical protein
VAKTFCHTSKLIFLRNDINFRHVLHGAEYEGICLMLTGVDVPRLVCRATTDHATTRAGWAASLLGACEADTNSRLQSLDGLIIAYTDLTLRPDEDQGLQACSPDLPSRIDARMLGLSRHRHTRFHICVSTERSGVAFSGRRQAYSRAQWGPCDRWATAVLQHKV